MPGRVLRAACIAVVVLAVGAGSARASEGEPLHAMKVDSTGLTSTAFFFTDTWFEGDEVETVELTAGTHYLQPGAGLVMACALVVTDAGTWAYATECDRFLSGRGTDTLRLIGFTITIDASPLSTPILLANLSVDQFGASPRPVTLLPTFADMLASPGPGVIAGCGFRVELDGTIAYSDEVHGCLTGRGTRTVTIHGFPVNVDARELSTPSFSIIQANSLMHQPSDVVQRYRLLPTATGYQYGAWTVSGILWPSLGLEIGLDGRIGYPASADGWVSGRGTDTLIIHGYTIQIDARAVPPNSFHIPDANAHGLGGAVHSLTLAPISYLYFTGEPTDFRFSIRESDGTIEVGADAACGLGQGTTLVVACRTLSVEDLTTDEPAVGSTARRTVRVSLSAPAPADVTVDYATTDGSATAPADYTARTGTLTIPAGRTGGPILLSVVGDGLDEPDEQLTITLSNPRGATIARGTATVTILNSSPPDTVITSGPDWESTVTTPATFEFVSTKPQSRFECSLQAWGPDDTTTWEPCTSPYRQPPGGFSYFEFKVRAIDLAGNVDPSPAERRYYHDPAPYGNFWIRGIDVFQVVQPNARARMYSYDPNNPDVSQLFPINCGAGTPTAFRSSIPGVSDCDRLAEDRQRVTYR
ncbi:MAG TPA: Calx-beta domain-containing protein, partial [Desertimonas sp.]|nr:Calx-beta domain-containing protein [Desertimonas sp.]